MSRNPDSFQPVAFFILLGPVRADENMQLSIGLDEVVKLPNNNRTMYVWGWDATTGQPVVIPWKGDPNEFPNVRIIETSLAAGVLATLVETFDPGVEVRSPRETSSRRLPDFGIIYDVTDSDPAKRLLAQLAQLSLGGFGSDEEQIRTVMNLARQLAVLGIKPPGPHWLEMKDFSEDGVEF